MDGIHLNRQMQNRAIKMVEAGAIKPDRNASARQKLSARYAAKQTDEPTASQQVTSSLWSDPEIQRTVDSMDPVARYELSKIGEHLFKSGGMVDTISAGPQRRDPNTELFECATQIQLMIRDGLPVDDLTLDEQRTLIAVMGPDEAESRYGLKLADDVIKVSDIQENGLDADSGVSKSASTHQRSKKGTRRPKSRAATAPNVDN